MAASAPAPAPVPFHTVRGLDGVERPAVSLIPSPSPTAIVGASPAIARLVRDIDTFAASDAHVLVTGESGTGKELVARRLHEQSERRSRPFVAVSCAALPETLLEAELFGHERGAFTGAVGKRDGRFLAADHGTLFLDEIAEVPLPAQAKLLRVLETSTFEPIGTNRSIRVDVRVISATHRNLRERVARGQFREDLYYRLKVLHLQVPPLRERRDDLLVLVRHFLSAFSVLPADSNVGWAPRFSPRAWAALEAYPFPGNVRELENAIQHAVVLARGGEIDLEHLPSEIAGSAGPERAAGVRPLLVAMHEFEREYLLRALALTCGRKAEAARLLGISRKALWEKLRRFEAALGQAAGDGRSLDELAEDGARVLVGSDSRREAVPVD